MTTALIAAASLGAIVLVAIWAGQRRLMYFPDARVPTPTAIGLHDVEPVSFTTSDAVALAGWFLPADRPRARFTAVVFNGNAGNRAYRVALAEALRDQGLAVLLFDYRGFGGNPGSPTEDGLLRDARAAGDYLLQRADVDRTRVVYFGESLGTGVAVRLAAERPPAALILRSPFASMIEVGQLHYGLLPVKWLLRDRFLSSDYILRVRCPVLVIAGDRDGIIPLEHSRRLFAAASEPKTFIAIADADHNDESLVHGAEMMRGIDAFLATVEPRS